jgi:hypothetical protein
MLKRQRLKVGAILRQQHNGSIAVVGTGATALSEIAFMSATNGSTPVTCGTLTAAPVTYWTGS